MPLYLKDKLVSGTGTPGKSAYEAAKAGGYTGTEASFNQALKDIPGHIADTENPHGVTAAQAGAIASIEKGATNGVATLGADALLAAAQRPKAGGLYRDDGTTTVEESLTEISTTLQKKADKDRVVNPNLLDKWYFVNPVNQRGQTEYSGNQSYIIDRWRMRGNGVTIGLETDGIVINCDGTSFNSIVQAFETPALLLGKTITLSALVTENTNTRDSIIEIGNGNNSSSAGTVLGETRFTGIGLFSVTVNVPSSLTNSYLTSIICAGNPSTNGARFKVAAAKLELGTQQTLAHQDADGVWQLNEIPNYWEQLAMCMRTLEYTVWQSSYGRANNTNDIFACISYFFKEVKRVTPAITVNTNTPQALRVYRVSTGELVSDAQLATVSADNTYMLCPRIYSPSGAFVANELYYCEIPDNAYIASADL